MKTKPPKGFYFREGDDERCYNLEGHFHYMIENDIKEMDIWLAKREAVEDYFYCTHFDQAGEKGDCGKICEAYKPRNGKSGACKHLGSLYERTDKCYALRIGNIDTMEFNIGERAENSKDLFNKLGI